MKKSVQMWDNRKLSVLEGEPVSGFPNTTGYTFLCCGESDDLFSVVCVECGLRVCYGGDPVTAIKKANDILTQYAKDSRLKNYLLHTTAAYHAYLAYVWARAGMYAHSPSGITTQPRFPLFKCHHMEDV